MKALRGLHVALSCWAAWAFAWLTRASVSSAASLAPSRAVLAMPGAVASRSFCTRSCCSFPIFRGVRGAVPSTYFGSADDAAAFRCALQPRVLRALSCCERRLARRGIAHVGASAFGCSPLDIGPSGRVDPMKLARLLGSQPRARRRATWAPYPGSGGGARPDARALRPPPPRGPHISRHRASPHVPDPGRGSPAVGRKMGGRSGDDPVFVRGTSGRSPPGTGGR